MINAPLERCYVNFVTRKVLVFKDTKRTLLQGIYKLEEVNIT